MAIDTRYMLSPPIWQVFTDKDTNEFLYNGYVLFFEDTNRMVGKPVFQITGSPPAYSYIPYGSLDINGAWRVNLNTQGAFTEAIYLFPYDSNGDPQNYFIQWYSEDDILQESREGWPNLGASGAAQESIEDNFVPNPQFLYHTTPPETPSFDVGEIRQATTEVAYGGWSFDRPIGSTAADFVTFERFNSFTTNPPANPRYACRARCTSPNVGDLFKDLTLSFSNVNKFSSDTQEYTFAFSGVTNSGLSTNVQLVLIKNFGTGGSPSPEDETILTTFAVSNSYSVTPYSYSFVFGSNAGETLGTNDDDFVYLALRFPVASSFDVSVTDCLLVQGVVADPLIPNIPDSIYDYQSYAGFLTKSANDGSDLYLPIILGPQGLTYDYSQIGRIHLTMNETLGSSELLCDGSTYRTADYSSTGIPYSRLWAINWDSTNNYNKWGNGSDFVTMFDGGSSSQMLLTTNTNGAVSATADGGVPTGFTFGAVTHTSGVNLGGQGLIIGNAEFFIWNIEEGSVPPAAANTSGFTVQQQFQTPFGGEDTSAPVRAVASITALAAAALAGKYFTFYTKLSGFTLSYYLWYTVDGAGADPAVGGHIGIQVNLLSTWTAAQVAQVTAMSITNAQISPITFSAGALALQNTYWYFYSSANQYLVWYNVNSLGTEPNVPGKINIEVAILSTDTAAQVATKTKIAINSFQYAVPDFRGKFIRSWDGSADIDQFSRWQTVPFAPTTLSIGTSQNQDMINHTHSTPFDSVTAAPGALHMLSNGGGGYDILDRTGGSESRPINISTLVVINY